jgi:hypothetical protein
MLAEAQHFFFFIWPKSFQCKIKIKIKIKVEGWESGVCLEASVGPQQKPLKADKFF